MESLPFDTGPKNRFRDAYRKPDFTIDQNWASYSAAEHDRWERLFRRSLAALQNRACDEFLAMMNALSLSDGGIPDMGKLSDRLENITGWRVVPVAGLVPDDVPSTTSPIGAFRPVPSSGLRRNWTTSRNRTSFTTFLATCRCWPTPSLRISWLPTARVDSERCNLASWEIWRGSIGTRSSSVSSGRQPGCEFSALAYCHLLQNANLRLKLIAKPRGLRSRARHAYRIHH
jgi:Biopterin-dependent aromatic amino acid hydroxylase